MAKSLGESMKKSFKLGDYEMVLDRGRYKQRKNVGSRSARKGAMAGAKLRGALSDKEARMLRKKGITATTLRNKLKKRKLRKVGGKKAGATLLKTKSGREIQAGVRGKKRGVHVDVGYDKKSKTAGAGITFTKKGKKPRSYSVRLKKE